MRKKKLLVLALALLANCHFSIGQNIRYVNPLIGTDVQRNVTEGLADSEVKGQTIPAVGVPNGMVSWVAQTMSNEQKCYSPYYYYQDKIEGFRASHWASGSCMQDYGSVTIMPVSRQLLTKARERASLFSHTNEVSKPDYYKVLLQDYGIEAEMTGLSRSGIFRFSYREGERKFLVIEPNSDKGIARIKIDAAKREITGYNPAHRIYQGSGKSAGFCGFFVIQLKDEIVDYGIWKGDSLHRQIDVATGRKERVGAWIELGGRGKNVIVKVGTSFTSIEEARQNLKSEIPAWNFDKTRKESATAWNHLLHKIQVRGTDETKKQQFYSALYAASLLPRQFNDKDGTYPRFASLFETSKSSHDYYSDFSMWDIYRAVLPLHSIINPRLLGDFCHSLVTMSEEGGWLPIFPAWNNYTAAMIGDHAIAALSDAMVKDIPGFNYEKAYTYMRKNAFEPNKDLKSYQSGLGRRALESYLKYGYIPLEDGVKDAFHKNEQVSRTLEYAYDDYALAQAAKVLGKTGDYKMLLERSQNYRHVIDSQTGYARGRHADGRWVEPFRPDKPCSYICEGTPYHYTWFVPHDIPGLQRIMGKERFSERLDNFFRHNYYWHGNEPGHHIAYLFAMTGEAWKTQHLIHQILQKEYFAAPDGLSGNDDAGQMSAWLVFSMMGFYPVCPSQPYYVLGSPSFEEITLHLDNGKKFTIQAQGYSEENIYIQKADLNGHPLKVAAISHEDIMKGGKLVLTMSAEPNTQWPAKEYSSLLQSRTPDEP